MTDDSVVVVDGIAGGRSPASASSGWVYAVVGFVLGLGLGLVVVDPGAGSTVTTQPSPGVNAPSTTSLSLVEDSGISQAVPQFPDVLIAVAETTGSSMEHLLWPRQGPIRIRPMTGGNGVTLDRSGQFVALTESLPGSEGTLLSTGRFNGLNAIATDVTSHVWHDEVLGSLSFTTQSDGVWRLFEARSSFQSRLIMESTELSGFLIGFGDWGWAVQTSPDEVTLFTSKGDLKGVEAGVGYATHRDGWVFVIAEDPKLVSAGGGVVKLDVNLDVGDIDAAEFSPDGMWVAVGGARGLAVLSVRSDAAVPFAGPSVSELAWSSDSRFVITSSGSGVRVHDLDTSDEFPLLRAYRILTVGTASVGDS